MSDVPDQVVPDVSAALGGIRRQLQAEPQRYRLFGLWWWWVKAELAKRYGLVELPILGDYVDPEQAETVAEFSVTMSDAAKLTAALQEYGFNARYAHPNGQVEWGSELLTLYDPDVEG